MREEKIVKIKIFRSQVVIREALERFGVKNTVLAWTGGKDSTLLVWMTKRVCEKNNVEMPRLLFIDEGDVFPKVKKFAKKLIKDWNLKVDFVQNDDVLKQVKKVKDKIVIRKLNKRNQKELKRLRFEKDFFYFEPESFVGNHLMKTVQMNIYLEENKIKALITGIRHDEHKARAKETYFSKRRNPSHVRVHPLLHFREKNVWLAIFKNEIPYVSLYKEGFRSLGAGSSTFKSSDVSAWKQDLKNTTERIGRRQDKEKIMEKLRKLGYM